MTKLFSQITPLQKQALIFNAIVRIFLPLCLFFNPLLGIVVGLITDGYDYYLLVRYAKLPNSLYQYQDKIFDHYWYILIFIYSSLYITNQLVQTTFLLTFIFRSIAHAIYLFTNNESIFYYFPNIQEPIFWIYILFPLFLNQYTLLPTLIFVTTFKLFIEYYIHIIHKNPINQFFQFFNIKTNF